MRLSHLIMLAIAISQSYGYVIIPVLSQRLFPHHFDIVSSQSVSSLPDTNNGQINDVVRNVLSHDTNSNPLLQDISHVVTESLKISSFYLSDTSISEEDVLDVVGTSTTLHDPGYAIGLAAFIFLGVAILQFSLGDLTKQEGQARVRDFLKTRGDTERKRGYFD